jgi:hypothetical protein
MVGKERMMRRIFHMISLSAFLSVASAFGLVGCSDCEQLNALSAVLDYDGGVFDGGPPLPVDGGLPEEVWLDTPTCQAVCGSISEHCSLYYEEWPDTDADTLVFLCYEPVCY